MGILSKLFGQEGKIRFEFETEDGQTAVAKVRVEMFNVGEAELKRKLAEMVYVETGHRVKNIRLLGFVEG